MGHSKKEAWDLMVLRDAVRYQTWILDTFGSAILGDVLEVGAGIGNYTRWLAQRSERLVAIEPDEMMFETLKSNVPAGVDVRQERIESLAEHHERFDCVIMLNVIEHIADDRAAVRVAASLLKPGGALCILVPAHQALYAQLDRLYDHLRRYSRDDVAAALKGAELDIATCHYFNPVGAIGWFVVAKLLRRQHISRRTVAASERIAVPLGRAWDRRGAPPFGQSVLAVGVKRPS